MIHSQFKVKWFLKQLNLHKNVLKGNNFDARKQLLQYDDVLRQQREIIYKQRFDVLETENLREIVEQMITSSLERNIASFAPMGDETDWNTQGLIDYVHGNLLNEGDLTIEDVSDKDAEELFDLIYGKVIAAL